MIISKEELKIRIHHVGGIGGYGPTSVLNKLKHIQWVIYDQEKEALNKSDKPLKGDYVFVNKCIGKDNSKATFNLMHAKSASSLLGPEPLASNYTVINDDGTAQIWGEHTKVTRKSSVKTYSLDWLVEKKKTPGIDFLSMDVQGAELDIINGASKNLQSSLIGVACEADFSELYKKQPLFGDIQIKLKENNFRLCQIYNNQFFNNAPCYKEIMGKGFQAVSESLFLKNPNFFNYHQKEDVVSAIKLAAIGVVFDQLDFSIGILKSLENISKISIEGLAKRTKVPYLLMLSDLYDTAKKIEEKNGQLTYRSTNNLDYEDSLIQEKFSERLVKIIQKIIVSLRFFLIIFKRRLLVSVGLSSNDYFSRISSIYAKYGLSDLAEIHDRRYVRFLINRYPTRLDKLLNTVLAFKPFNERERANRNYFKGYHL